MSFPRVSVIVPVWNRRAFLESCLASIQATNYPDLEVLLIDDGSTDGSWELILGLADRSDGMVKRLHHRVHRHMGIAASRNLGLRHATGAYLSFLDTDDLYEPCRFDSCIKALESQPSLHAVYEPVRIINGNQGHQETSPGSAAKPVPSELVPSLKSIATADQDSLCWVFLNDWWLMPGITLRRSFVERYGGFRCDLPVAEDTELWIRLAATGAIRCAQSREPVALVQRHAGGHSWDGIPLVRRARLYRKALRSGWRATCRRPDLFLTQAPDALKRRYRKAITDDVGRFAARRSRQALLGVLAEAAIHQPASLLSRRVIGNARKGLLG